MAPPIEYPSPESINSQSRTHPPPGYDKDGNPKPAKRRATRACRACGVRKVRCDVMQGYHFSAQGQPKCSNCILDSIECVVEPSKRRKKQIENGIVSLAHLPAPQQFQLPQSQFEAHHAHHAHHARHSHHVHHVHHAHHVAHPLVNPPPLSLAHLPIPPGSTVQGLFATPQSTLPPFQGSWEHVLTNSRNENRRWSSDSTAISSDEETGHVSHQIYQKVQKMQNRQKRHPQISPSEMLQRGSFIQGQELDPNLASRLMQSASLTGDLTATKIDSTPQIHQEQVQAPILKHKLPANINPLPPRMTLADIDYLYQKSALLLPSIPLRNALLRSYLEYVQPYMPILDTIPILQTIDDETGASGKISLLLFQSIMFSSIAFVDEEMLKKEGFPNRKEARRSLFQRVRLLYDFDYEENRVVLVQSLLLMTYWYETPTDQKDTWHWLGIAISLAHTIGMHRDPESMNMRPSQKKLWKRVWWSCFMRDRLVALGMRRPTRIQEADFNVPMLTEDDFELAPLPENNRIFSASFALPRDPSLQKQLATLCIAKAKLCLCIGHILREQYSVLVKQIHGARQGETDEGFHTSALLAPKRSERPSAIKACDDELEGWFGDLSTGCLYSTQVESEPSGSMLFVHRSLLHMIYYTAISALHRPQVASFKLPEPLRETSAQKVLQASIDVADIGKTLVEKNLVKYMPTTTVTSLLPAVLVQLTHIRSAELISPNSAILGLSKCLLVLSRLRNMYESADYAVPFLRIAATRSGLLEVWQLAESAGEKYEKANSGNGTIEEVLTQQNSKYRRLPNGEKPRMGSTLQQDHLRDMDAVNMDYIQQNNFSLDNHLEIENPFQNPLFTFTQYEEGFADDADINDYLNPEVLWPPMESQLDSESGETMMDFELDGGPIGRNALAATMGIPGTMADFHLPTE